jgi:hypothetical protein
MSKGVLILAMGHPYYGEMAANLAMSLKFADKETKICLAWEGDAKNHLTPAKLNLFDVIKEVPQEYILKGGKKAYFKAKTYINKLTPFDETIFLDADMIWFGKKPISQLFEELKDLDFTIQNRDFIDFAVPIVNENYSIWANVQEIKDTYKFNKGRYYSLHSEFIYFKKTKAVEAYFKDVQKIYENPKVKATVFAGDIADELAFTIAMCKHELYPHKTPFLPIYWAKAETSISINKAIEKYYAYSMGGNTVNSTMTQKYDAMAKAYAYHMGLKAWTFKPKNRWLQERQKL